MKKQRQQILLEPEQKQRLQEESDHTGAPKSEIVRRALDQYFSDDDEWDRQIESDIKSGRFDRGFADIISEAKKQYEKGEYTEL